MAEQLVVRNQLQGRLHDAECAGDEEPAEHGEYSPSSHLGWHLHTYQLTMGKSGTARVGIHIFSSHPQADTEVVVELGAVVLAPIGQEWSRLAGR